MAKPAIVVENMSMMFNLNKEKVDNLKEYFIKGGRRNGRGKKGIF